MICPECREGADLASQVREMPRETSGMRQLVKSLWGNVGLFHGRCQGGTHCDCQCKIGEVDDT